jgi:hypothetical protein
MPDRSLSSRVLRAFGRLTIGLGALILVFYYFGGWILAVWPYPACSEWPKLSLANAQGDVAEIAVRGREPGGGRGGRIPAKSTPWAEFRKMRSLSRGRTALQSTIQLLRTESSWLRRGQTFARCMLRALRSLPCFKSMKT